MYLFCLEFIKKIRARGRSPLQTPPTLKHRSGASRRCPETNKISQRPRYSEMRLPAATRGFVMHGVHSYIIIPKYMNTFVIKWYRKMNSIVDVLIIEYRYFLYKLCTETVYKRREKKLIFCGKKKSFVAENVIGTIWTESYSQKVSESGNVVAGA